MKTILLVVLSSVVALGQRPADNVKGIVTAEGSDAPVANAEIELVPRQTAQGNSSSGSRFRSVTDAAGKFSFNILPPGSYWLKAQATGYVEISVGRTSVVIPRESSEDIALRLVPTGTVAGRVQDSTGRAIPNIDISFIPHTHNELGQLMFLATATVRTNDLGEYRMWMAPPGRYIVKAGSAGSFATTPAQQDEGYPDTLYPGVADRSRAAMIDVRPMTAIVGIDLTLVRRQLYRIRGRTVDASTGQPASALGVLARLDDAGGHTPAGTFISDSAAGGVVDVGNLLPGSYMLTAIERTSGGSTNEGSSISRVVVISGADLTDLILPMTLHARIDGRLQVDGELPGSASMPAFRIVAFGRRSTDLGALQTVRPDANGAFSLHAPKEIDLRLTMSNLSPGLFLESARLNGVDVLSGFSSFTGGNLEVVISSRGGSIEGRALDAKLGAVPDAQVVLVPVTPRSRPDLFKAVKADTEGRFRISDIAPGDYQVFAWPAIEERRWFDPEILSRYETSAKSLHIDESSKQNIDATVMAAPESSR